MCTRIIRYGDCFASNRDICIFASPRAQLNLSKNQITCITIVTTASYFRLVQGMAMESLLAYMDTSYEAANDAFKRGIMYEVMKVGCKNGSKRNMHRFI